MLLKYEEEPDKTAVLGPAIQLRNGKIQDVFTGALGLKGAVFTWLELFLDYLHLHNADFNHLLYLWSRKQRVPILHGCALLFTPVFFKYYDGFYPRTFLYAEEQILYLMCKYAGIQQKYVPESMIFHKEDQSSEMSFGNDKRIDVKYNLQSYKWVVWWALKNTPLFAKKGRGGKRKK